MIPLTFDEELVRDFPMASRAKSLWQYLLHSLPLGLPPCKGSSDGFNLLRRNKDGTIFVPLEFPNGDKIMGRDLVLNHLASRMKIMVIKTVTPRGHICVQLVPTKADKFQVCLVRPLVKHKEPVIVMSVALWTSIRYVTFALKDDSIATYEKESLRIATILEENGFDVDLSFTTCSMV
jgi:hypothetical protein